MIELTRKLFAGRVHYSLVCIDSNYDRDASIEKDVSNFFTLACRNKSQLYALFILILVTLQNTFQSLLTQLVLCSISILVLYWKVELFLLIDDLIVRSMTAYVNYLRAMLDHDFVEWINRDRFPFDGERLLSIRKTLLYLLILSIKVKTNIVFKQCAMRCRDHQGICKQEHHVQSWLTT